MLDTGVVDYLAAVLMMVSASTFVDGALNAHVVQLRIIVLPSDQLSRPIVLIEG